MQLTKKTLIEWIYTTEKGVEIPLKEMTHEHLVNAYSKGLTTYDHENVMVQTLKAEILRRLRLKIDDRK